MKKEIAKYILSCLMFTIGVVVLMAFACLIKGRF